MSIDKSKRDKYMKFIESTYVPIFSQIYWLDVVCDKDWDVWFFESGGNIEAALPYRIVIKDGYKIITRPPLTQNNGIILSKLEQQKNATREANQEQIISKAIDYIQSLNLDLFEQQFHYKFINWLPFYWANYTALVRYTYLIATSDLSIDKVFDLFDSKLKNCIRKAENRVQISSISADEFYKYYADIFSKKNLTPSISKEKWIELYEVCANQEIILLLKAEECAQVQSVACFVEDARSVYLLMGGTFSYTTSNCAYDYLIWWGIKYAATRKKDFDFEGSVIKDVNQNIRKFGGQAMPYFRIRKVFNNELLSSELRLHV